MFWARLARLTCNAAAFVLQYKNHTKGNTKRKRRIFMDKRNRPALAYLLIGVTAAGRALLAVPEAVALQEVSLTMLAVVGYILLAGKGKLPLLLGVGQLILELLLCGAGQGGSWLWLEPALRAADLWMFWGTALLMLRHTGQNYKVMPAVAAVPLAGYSVAHFMPAMVSVASVCFVAFSVVMLGYAAMMVRAYNTARVK